MLERRSCALIPAIGDLAGAEADAVLVMGRAIADRSPDRRGRYAARVGLRHNPPFTIAGQRSRGDRCRETPGRSAPLSLRISHFTRQSSMASVNKVIIVGNLGRDPEGISRLSARHSM